MSTPRSLRMSRQVRLVAIETGRGSFAALAADSATGVDERLPALLVPGYTGSKEDFLAVLDSLAAAGRRVVAIDLRGQYQSGPAPASDGYRLDRLADDVVAVAAAIGGSAGRVHLLGHSFGGLVVRQAAITQADRFSSLTLLGSGPGTIGGERAAALRELLDYLRPAGADRTALAPMIADLWESRLRPQAVADGTSAEIVEFLRDRTLGNCPVGLVEMATQLLDCPDRTDHLAQLSGLPMLVSYGEHDDAWPPAVQDAMARRLDAERVCIPGAAHSPAVEAPETTAAML
ncbi:MAG: alpha/beta fold hydrolase, partial [Actinomycetota bacterium]|nr:alpha/beta fold hydrolase [Actinomycetota bacterium]